VASTVVLDLVMRACVELVNPTSKRDAIVEKSTRRWNATNWKKRRKATTGLENSIATKPATALWIVESTSARRLAIPKITGYHTVFGRLTWSPIVLAGRLLFSNYADSPDHPAQIRYLIAKSPVENDWLAGTLVSRFATLEIVFHVYGQSRSNVDVEGMDSTLSVTRVMMSLLNVYEFAKSI
jgi:hypothetical protein